MSGDIPRISFRIEGLDKIRDAYRKSPEIVGEAFQAAGKEMAAEIVETEGLQNYPPAGTANRPPYPYYERGLGVWTSPRNNLYNSERLGTQFYVETPARSLRAEIGNRASYAEKVIGESQGANMASIGWRRLIDVAEEKTDKLGEILDAWLQRAIAQVIDNAGE